MDRYNVDPHLCVCVCVCVLLYIKPASICGNMFTYVTLLSNVCSLWLLFVYDSMLGVTNIDVLMNIKHIVTS